MTMGLYYVVLQTSKESGRTKRDSSSQSESSMSMDQQYTSRYVLKLKLSEKTYIKSII